MKQRWMWLGAAIGSVLLVAGVGLLTVWEAEMFRVTTLDRDFTGLTCGTPHENPAWPTGHPCHGAVNRQTGAGWAIAVSGLCLNVASFATLVAGPDVYRGAAHRDGRNRER